LTKKADYMLNLVDAAIQSVRKIAKELRPGVLDELGLAAAIEWQAREFEQQSGIPCQVNIPKNPAVENQGFSIAVFRIFQEALTNIIRHAQATLVSVELAIENNFLYLRIDDNGKGIDEKDLHDPASIGILGMKERAFPFGGTVRVSPREGHGTQVLAQFPVKPS
jgi:two-component system, NarL family, sensor histidine kinase UhpB